MDIAVAGNLAFVASEAAGLQVLDVRNPVSPTLVGSCATPGPALGVVVAGELAFVAAYDAGVFAIQAFQHEVDALRNIGRSVAVDGGTASIARVRLSTTQTPGVTWDVSADNGAAWQAITPDNAWNVFSVSGNDLVWRSVHTWAPGVNPTASELHLEWLYESAAIEAVTDIPNDQGRQVRVEWTRSGHDFIGDPMQIVEYAVYRKIDPDLGATSVPSSLPAFDHLSPAARQHALTMLDAQWDFITTVPVRVEDSYAVVAPTLKDSTIAEGDYQSTFMVSALTATPGLYFDSLPVSGHSVDNLAPSAPANVSIAYNTGGGNTLSWDESLDADFQYFRVYRSTNPDFTPSPATLVHATTANSWVDPDYDGWAVYYKLTATDFSGNESEPTEGGTTTGVGGPAIPKSFALHPNVPNPFNPVTTIRYDVPEDGVDVILQVYDVGGRPVKTLTAGRQSAGVKTVAWDGRDDAGRPVATGVYFCRFTAPGYTKTNKMVLMK
jgi:hypothetical protein